LVLPLCSSVVCTSVTSDRYLRTVKVAEVTKIIIDDVITRVQHAQPLL
jgi:hypothetical protein